MNGRRAIIGLCMLCALVFSAFAAQSASAATKGTTIFTCSSSAAVKDFNNPDCETGAGSSFGHVAVAEKEKTHLTAVDTGGAAKLKATISGSAIELQAKHTHVTGVVENTKEASGEHMFHGREIVIEYTEVTEKLLGCQVEGTSGGVATPGVVKTNKLTATGVEVEKANGEKVMGIRFTPEVGGSLFDFDLFGPPASCVFKTGEPVFKVIGSIVVFPNGATLESIHSEVTFQKTLRIGSAAGPIVGYEGTVTVSAGKEPKTEPTSPLSLTTVETA